MTHHWRFVLCAVLVALFLVGCFPHTVPVYRIGLVLPLEGRYRAVAYDVFFASRLALLDALRAGSMEGYRVELVVYDDLGDPAHAASHAEALAIDPTVLAVVGHWRPATTAAAIPVYRAAQIPLITADSRAVEDGNTTGVFILDARPGVWRHALDAYLASQGITSASIYPPDLTGSITEAARLALAGESTVRIGGPEWGLAQFYDLVQSAAPTMEDELWFLTPAAWPADLPGGDSFRQAILNSDPSAVEPGPYSALAYDAVALALEAIRQAHADGPLTRQSVAQAIAAVDFDGLTGSISFDQEGFRQDVPLVLYRWDEERIPTLLERLQ